MPQIEIDTAENYGGLEKQVDEMTTNELIRLYLFFRRHQRPSKLVKNELSRRRKEQVKLDYDGQGDVIESAFRQGIN